MTESLLASLGVYVGFAAIGFVAGLFPLVSVEIILGIWSAARGPSLPELVAWAAMAAVGHQIAKTLCYFAGTGALEHRRIKPQIERARGRIDRWNRYPLSVFFFSATVGFPPMYLLGFIARPLMRIRFVPFTVLCLVGRFGRYTTIAVAALLAY